MSEIQYEPDGNVKDMDGGYSTTIKTIHTNFERRFHLKSYFPGEQNKGLEAPNTQ